MLFYTWIFIIFNLVWSHADNKERNKGETEFAGVLQNITRVNKVLQDLIHNYKELQSIYNTEETFDKTLSDADDINVVEKDADVSKHNEDANAKIRATPRNFPVTNIGLDYFNSGENYVHNNKIPKIKREEKTKKSRVTPQVVAFQLNGDLKHVHVDTKSTESAEIKTSNEEKDSSNEMKIKTGNLNHNNKDINNERKIDDTQALQENASSEFESNKENADDEDEVLRSQSFKSIQNGKSYTKDSIWVKMPRENINSTEINGTFDAYEDKSEKENKMESVNDDDDDESELEVALSDDLQQTNILRAAYGDACLRLVIKKCFKACKDAIKDSCSDSGCKFSLKKALKKAAKSKCLHYFITNGNNNSSNNNDTMRINPLLVNFDGEKGFTDMTRQGYLATYCMTETEKAAQKEEPMDKRVFRNETPSEVAADNPFDTEMNILRDRYERACIKVSRKKCIKACKCTFKDTCAEHSCHKGLKRVSIKSCKRKCSNWFKDNGKNKKKDDDSDSDDDDSDSDDDDDDDDSD